MKEYLKEYQVILKTIGPVYVGSGRDIGKKEYLFLNKKKVGIPDIGQLYAELTKRKKALAFEEYLLKNNRDDLTRWMQDQRIDVKDMEHLIKYTLDCGDAVLERGKGGLQIQECMKDAYGNPYIPGSSLKGMLRTVLLSQDIISNPAKYQRYKSEMRQAITAQVKTSRNTFLKKNISDMENVMFHTLDREGMRPSDAVNDYMQGFIVSDSEPLQVDNLVLCQRVELHPDGTEKRLNVLRECIKPGTEIRFTITIDSNLCSLDEESLRQAVASFAEQYNQNFVKAFTGQDRLRENYLYVGGSCGFVTKTVVYPLFSRKDGIEMTKGIFAKTGVPVKHKHIKDTVYGASPHILKCTRYQGKLLQMGLCAMNIQLR